MAATPARLPTMHVTAPAPSPPARRPSKPSRRLAIFVFLGGAAALLAWLGLRNTAPRPRLTARPSPAPRPPAPQPPAPPPPAPAPPLSSPAPPPAPAEPAEIAGKGAKVVESEEIRPTPQPPQAEDDEETLLKHSEPAASDQILGEAEGEGPAKPVAAKHGGRAKPERTLPESVSVHIESRPQGAVVKLKDRVFGRSPLNLRFRPGISYELTFVKQGYQNASKRFTVSGRKNQNVRVALKKKPAQKKSLLRRIFGR
jgi:hypothetical protein